MQKWFTGYICYTCFLRSYGTFLLYFVSFASFFEFIIVTAWKEWPVHSAKCTQKRKSYKFGTTWGSVNNDRIVIVLFFPFFLSFFLSIDSLQGEYQRKLYKELMENYNRLERPVLNDSAPIVVDLGLTLLQIIDVVSVCFCFFFMWSSFHDAGLHHTMHIPLPSVL